jgi:hypothetical protein
VKRKKMRDVNVGEREEKEGERERETYERI